MPSPFYTIAEHSNIPPSVRIVSFAYTIHRNGDIYPAPEEWKLDRWFDAMEKELVKTQDEALVFLGSSRARMCIMNHIAVYCK